jgi:hypothetical protein
LRVSKQVFVRNFLSDFYLHRFISGLITEDQYYGYQSILVSKDFEQFARDLYARAPSPVTLPGCGVVRLVRLLELDRSEFPFLLALPPRRRATRTLTCFVGHRFLRKIERPLRFNLRHVLNPYRIAIDWSAKDLSASDVFNDIVAGIGKADMCFFDTLGTASKPNVYIELGIAYALGVPTIFAEYIGGPSPTVPSGIPSDLQGLFRIRYRNYQELFRTLYFGLPNFIATNRIRRG